MKEFDKVRHRIEIVLVPFMQIPYVTAAFLESKLGAEGRKDLFEWLSRQLSQLSDFPDAVQLLKPAVVAMTVFLLFFLLFF